MTRRAPSAPTSQAMNAPCSGLSSMRAPIGNCAVVSARSCPSTCGGRCRRRQTRIWRRATSQPWSGGPMEQLHSLPGALPCYSAALLDSSATPQTNITQPPPYPAPPAAHLRLARVLQQVLVEALIHHLPHHLLAKHIVVCSGWVARLLLGAASARRAGLRQSQATCAAESVRSSQIMCR